MQAFFIPIKSIHLLFVCAQKKGMKQQSLSPNEKIREKNITKPIKAYNCSFQNRKQMQAFVWLFDAVGMDSFQKEMKQRPLSPREKIQKKQYTPTN